MRFLPRERVDAEMRARKQAVAAVLSAAADGYQRADATVLLEMSAGLVGDLRRGRVDRVTLDRLVRSAVRLGCEVRVEVVPPSAGPRRGVPGTGVDVPASERASVSEPGTSPRSRA
jgi:predicted XRE-type DNA-binding protein